jgi:hypothetical protein
LSQQTLAQSYVTKYPTPGAAAELAASRKSDKYANLPNSYLFEPIALENLGAINESATSLISELGRKISGPPAIKIIITYFRSWV